MSVAFIKSWSGNIRKYNKGLKVVTEDFSDNVGHSYTFVYKKSKDNEYVVDFQLGADPSLFCDRIRIKLPKDDWYTCQWTKDVLCHLIDYFDVTYGGLLPSYYLRFEHRVYRMLSIYPGWINYFPNEAELPDMSDYEVVEDYKGKVKIYTLQKDEFDRLSRDQCRKWLYTYKKIAVKFGVPRNE